MRHALRIVFALAMVFSIAGVVTDQRLALSAAQETGTVRITFRGCPDGPINPNTISLDTCTIPLDAPDESIAFWRRGNETNRLHVATDVERSFNGTYVIDDIPVGAEVELRGFQPVAHNYYEFIGVDDNWIDGPWTGRLSMASGGTRDVVVFYWNGEDGFHESERSTLELTLRGCPDFVNPLTVDDPEAVCTTPLDAPDNAQLVWDMEGGALVANAPRLNDGTYRIEGIPPFLTVGLTGFEPSVRDTFAAIPVDRTTDQGIPQVLVYRGETIRVHVFYYNTGAESPAPEAGTIDITLRGCPEGVDPTTIANPADECTIPLDAPELAGVVWGGDGQGGLEVRLAPRLDDGTYHLDNVPAQITVRLSGFEPSERDSFLIVGDVEPVVNADAELYVEPGVSYQVYVYYYNAP